MNQFNQAFLQSVAFFMAEWSARWAVLIVVLLASLAIWRPRRAATRLLMCQLVLVGGLLLPVLPRCWGPALMREPAKERMSQPALAKQLSPLGHNASAAVVNEPVTKLPARRQTTGRLTAEVMDEPSPQIMVAPVAGMESSREVGSNWTMLIVSLTLLWLCGTALLLGRLALNIVALRRLRLSGLAASAAALEQFRVCRGDMAVDRPADLLFHPGLRAPIMVGGRPAAIVLPADWDELPLESRRTGLLHELTHLGRRDDWAKLAEEAVRAVFFFHPLVRWLLTRLDGEREQVCDAAVVRQGVGPRRLAQVLLEFVQRLGPGGPAATFGTAVSFFNRITVRDRIHHLLEDDMTRWITPMTRGKKAALAASMATLMIGLGSFGVKAVAPPEEAASPPAAQPETAKRALVKGVVQDEEGHPVAGADVLLHRIRGSANPLLTRTAEDGSFQVDSLPADKPNRYLLSLIAGKEGFAPGQGYTKNNDDSSVMLKLSKTATVGGTIKDQGGRPVGGARVQLGTVHRFENGAYWGYTEAEAVAGTPLERFFFTKSDGKGEFRFAAAPKDQELIFWVEAEGFADLDTGAKTPKREHFAKADAPPVALVLAPEGRISGQLVSRVDGAKTAGLQIWLKAEKGWNLSHPKQTRTDEAGRFTLRGLPEGTYFVLLQQAPDGAPWTAREAPLAKVRPGDTSKVEIELIGGVLVEGMAVSGDTDKPVAGADVMVTCPARPFFGFPYLSARTDSEGCFSLRLPPGPAVFVVETSLTSIQGLLNNERQTVVIPEGIKSLKVSNLSARPIPGLRLPNTKGIAGDAIEPPVSKKSEVKGPSELPGGELVGVKTADVRFRTDYHEGRLEAHRRGLPIAVYCTRDDCPFSLRLERETFSDPIVAKWLNEKFLPIKVRDPRLTSDLKIRAFPTVILAAPDGKILMTVEGFQDADKFNENLQDVLTWVNDPKRKKLPTGKSN